jgi:exodeoxyribonuclease VII large subunit
VRRGDDPDAGERPWNRWLERSGERVGGSGSGAPGNGPSGDGQPGNGPPGPEPPPLWGNPGPDRMQQQGRPPSIRVWTIAELTRAIRDVLRGVDRFRDVWVEGEIGQVSVSAAGHAFFVLRDDRTQLNCVFFQRERLASPFEPQTGLRVVVHGRVDVYEPGGAYQLYVDALQPAGFGDLALRFEALKAQLAAEGLFDVARRQPLPAVPRVVGVATSATGAVLHDIRRVLARRWPLTRLVLAPCLVQGDAAPESIVAALRRLARWEDPATGEAVDVVILARGGGSAEDLWAFNDERVVRAVAACPVPVVTGVGHETDVTLADFAADVRAPTPSAAAELVTPSREAARERLREARRRLGTSAVRTLAGPRQVLTAERRALMRLHPGAVLAADREEAGRLLERARRAADARWRADERRLARAADRLPFLVAARVDNAAGDVRTAAVALTVLSPYATLDRGYAIVRDGSGRVLREAAAVAAGDQLDVRLAKGSLDARVVRVRDSGP